MALLTANAWMCRRWLARSRWVAALLGLTLLGWAAPEAAAPPAPSAEYQLKAVFLFNFAQFAEWPAPAFHDGATPLVIGILGNDPFGRYLDELVSGENVGGRPLSVRRYKRVEEITECHILFISDSEVGSLDDVIGRLKDRSILTVGDVDSFTRHGGMIRFVTESGKLRLRINLEAATASGLTISSKLLRASTIVKTGKE